MTDKLVIIGAGMGGVSAAYYLAVQHGVKNIVLIDERDPLTLTSDKGTQGYRNWWPGPDNTMLRFISRSIDLMEQAAGETNNLFRLNRRGYLFATATDAGVHDLRNTAARVSSFGMGMLREHTSHSTYAPAPAEGYSGQPDGADLLLGDAAHAAFPFLTTRTRATLHVRRAGWMNAPAMGSWMLRQAVSAGVTFVRDRVTRINRAEEAKSRKAEEPKGRKAERAEEPKSRKAEKAEEPKSRRAEEANIPSSLHANRVCGVTLASGTEIEADIVVLAAGPMLHDASRMLGISLPLHHELHAKVTFADTQHIIPRWAPFTIWNDPVQLDGQQFPAGVHVRPVDGPRGNELFAIWTYHTEQCTPSWPPPFDAGYSRNCILGLAAMAPGMQVYANSHDYGVTDGGYYCKASDNRPLIGPLPIDGAFVLGALSGTGIMSAHAAGELLALHVTGKTLPDYAEAFLPSRFDSAAYAATVEGWGRMTGQL